MNLLELQRKVRGHVTCMPSDGGSGGGGDGGSSGSAGGNGSGSGGGSDGAGGFGGASLGGMGTGFGGFGGASLGGGYGGGLSGGGPSDGFGGGLGGLAGGIGAGGISSGANIGSYSGLGTPEKVKSFAEKNPFAAAVISKLVGVSVGALASAFGPMGPLAGFTASQAVSYAMSRTDSPSERAQMATETQASGVTPGPNTPGGGGGGSNSDALWSTALGGVLSSFGGNGSNASSAADPFGSQRPLYQKMLQDLMTNPDSFKQSPASLVASKAGMAGIDANMAAKGLGNSGAQQMALTQFATDTAGKDYQQQISNLMTLSGAQSGSPAAAGQLIGQQNSANSAALGTLAGVAGPMLKDWWTSTDFSGGNSTIDTSNWASGSDSAFGSGTEDMGNFLGTGSFW